MILIFCKNQAYTTYIWLTSTRDYSDINLKYTKYCQVIFKRVDISFVIVMLNHVRGLSNQKFKKKKKIQWRLKATSIQRIKNPLYYFNVLSLSHEVNLVNWKSRSIPATEL